jgi:hypothetical protein
MSPSALKMETARFSERLASTNPSTRRLDPKQQNKNNLFIFWDVLMYRRIAEGPRQATSNLDKNRLHVTLYSNEVPSQKGSLCLYYLPVVCSDTNSVAPEPEGLPPHSQQPANDPYPEPGESNPSPQDPF